MIQHACAHRHAGKAHLVFHDDVLYEVSIPLDNLLCRSFRFRCHFILLCSSFHLILCSVALSHGSKNCCGLSCIWINQGIRLQRSEHIVLWMSRTSRSISSAGLSSGSLASSSSDSTFVRLMPRECTWDDAGSESACSACSVCYTSVYITEVLVIKTIWDTIEILLSQLLSTSNYLQAMRTTRVL